MSRKPFGVLSANRLPAATPAHSAAGPACGAASPPRLLHQATPTPQQAGDTSVMYDVDIFSPQPQASRGSGGEASSKQPAGAPASAAAWRSTRRQLKAFCAELVRRNEGLSQDVARLEAENTSLRHAIAALQEMEEGAVDAATSHRRLVLLYEDALHAMGAGQIVKDTRAAVRRDVEAAIVEEEQAAVADALAGEPALHAGATLRAPASPAAPVSPVAAPGLSSTFSSEASASELMSGGAVIPITGLVAGGLPAAPSPAAVPVSLPAAPAPPPAIPASPLLRPADSTPPSSSAAPDPSLVSSILADIASLLGPPPAGNVASASGASKLLGRRGSWFGGSSAASTSKPRAAARRASEPGVLPQEAGATGASRWGASDATATASAPPASASALLKDALARSQSVIQELWAATQRAEASAAAERSRFDFLWPQLVLAQREALAARTAASVIAAQVEGLGRLLGSVEAERDANAEALAEARAVTEAAAERVAARGEAACSPVAWPAPALPATRDAATEPASACTSSCAATSPMAAPPSFLSAVDAASSPCFATSEAGMQSSPLSRAEAATSPTAAPGEATSLLGETHRSGLFYALSPCSEAGPLASPPLASRPTPAHPASGVRSLLSPVVALRALQRSVSLLTGSVGGSPTPVLLAGNAEDAAAPAATTTAPLASLPLSGAAMRRRWALLADQEWQALRQKRLQARSAAQAGLLRVMMEQAAATAAAGPAGAPAVASVEDATATFFSPGTLQRLPSSSMLLEAAGARVLPGADGFSSSASSDEEEGDEEAAEATNTTLPLELRAAAAVLSSRWAGGQPLEAGFSPFSDDGASEEDEEAAAASTAVSSQHQLLASALDASFGCDAASVGGGRQGLDASLLLLTPPKPSFLPRGWRASTGLDGSAASTEAAAAATPSDMRFYGTASAFSLSLVAAATPKTHADDEEMLRRRLRYGSRRPSQVSLSSAWHWGAGGDCPEDEATVAAVAAHQAAAGKRGGSRRGTSAAASTGGSSRARSQAGSSSSATTTAAAPRSYGSLRYGRVAVAEADRKASSRSRSRGGPPAAPAANSNPDGSVLAGSIDELLTGSMVSLASSLARSRNAAAAAASSARAPPATPSSQTRRHEAWVRDVLGLPATSSSAAPPMTKSASSPSLSDRRLWRLDSGCEADEEAGTGSDAASPTMTAATSASKATKRPPAGSLDSGLPLLKDPSGLRRRGWRVGGDGSRSRAASRSRSRAASVSSTSAGDEEVDGALLQSTQPSAPQQPSKVPSPPATASGSSATRSTTAAVPATAPTTAPSAPKWLKAVKDAFSGLLPAGAASGGGSSAHPGTCTCSSVVKAGTLCEACTLPLSKAARAHRHCSACAAVFCMSCSLTSTDAPGLGGATEGGGWTCAGCVFSRSIAAAAEPGAGLAGRLAGSGSGAALAAQLCPELAPVSPPSGASTQPRTSRREREGTVTSSSHQRGGAPPPPAAWVSWLAAVNMMEEGEAMNSGGGAVSGTSPRSPLEYMGALTPSSAGAGASASSSSFRPGQPSPAPVFRLGPGLR